MWPACINCDTAVPDIDDKYCGGDHCVNPDAGKRELSRQSMHKPFTKKKLTRAIIKARRKKGKL